MNIIRAGEYHDIPALFMENEILCVAVLPTRGSKIASLFHKPGNVELLWQPPDESYPAATYFDSSL